MEAKANMISCSTMHFSIMLINSNIWPKKVEELANLAENSMVRDLEFFVCYHSGQDASGASFFTFLIIFSKSLKNILNENPFKKDTKCIEIFFGNK